jgi:hypothetical protein
MTSNLNAADDRAATPPAEHVGRLVAGALAAAWLRLVLNRASVYESDHDHLPIGATWLTLT